MTTISTIDIYSRNYTVDENNLVDVLNQLARNPQAIKAHEEWERVDQELKDAVRNEAYDSEILSLAAQVRSAKKKKDDIFDYLSILMEKAAWDSGIIEDYTDDVLGDAVALDNVEELSVAWHNNRRRGIGGSSLSESLGFHWKSHCGKMIYMSDHSIDDYWLNMSREKSTVVEEAHIPTSGVLFRGHKIEPALIARYAVIENKRVAVSKATWQGVYDVQVINVDGIILDDKGRPEGLLECKTSSREWTWQWGVPIHYRCQVLWYLRATGLKYADVLVKFDSGVFDTFRIYADETIDGTSDTDDLDGYIDELFDNWEDVKKYKENPSLLWEDHPILKEETRQVDKKAIVNTDNDEAEIANLLVQSPVVYIHKTQAYERLEERLDEYDHAIIAQGALEKTTRYNVEGISPIFYPLDGEYGKPIKTPVDIVPEDDVMVALDTDTYNYICDFFEPQGIINASALRRIIELKPAQRDFRSIEEYSSWVENLLQGE